MKALRLAAVAALIALSCGTAAAQSALRIGLAEDPDVLDPTLARTYVGRIVFASICDKLFDVNEKLEVVPQLALSHETSEDGKTVTIKLRPGVKFHDGEPLDAEAAKYSLERHVTMNGSFRKPDLAPVDKVEVVDPLTIRLLLKAPSSPLIAQLTDRAGMMVSPKAAKEAGDKFGLKPICAGPYKFVERVQQDRIVVEKFAEYWNKDNVHIDRITYLPILDATVRLANLRSGGLDLLERLAATDIAAVKGDSKLKLSAVPDLSYWGITINVANGDKAKNPLGQHAKVRQALELSLDREAINQVVFNGEFVPGNQWIGPDSFYYQKSLAIPKRDIAKAKALIKEAGIATPVTIDFMVPQGAENKAISEVVQAMAAEAGFDMKIRVTEFASSLKAAEQGDYQAYLIGWSGRTDPDGNLYTFHACNAPNNNGKYCNPEVDKLLNEARTFSEPAKRKPLYERVARILLQEGHIIYLYHRKVLIAHTLRIEGFKPVPDGLVRVVGLKLK